MIAGGNTCMVTVNTNGKINLIAILEHSANQHASHR